MVYQTILDTWEQALAVNITLHIHKKIDKVTAKRSLYRGSGKYIKTYAYVVEYENELYGRCV
jgi:hypothetical protein